MPDVLDRCSGTLLINATRSGTQSLNILHSEKLFLNALCSRTMFINAVYKHFTFWNTVFKRNVSRASNISLLALNYIIRFGEGGVDFDSLDYGNWQTASSIRYPNLIFDVRNK